MRTECLAWLLILNGRHLERVLRIYLEHYQRQWPHRGLDLRPPSGSPRARVTAIGGVHRRDVLGGLVHAKRSDSPAVSLAVGLRTDGQDLDALAWETAERLDDMQGGRCRRIRSALGSQPPAGSDAPSTRRTRARPSRTTPSGSDNGTVTMGR